jgi:hypothetical protein
MANKLSLEDLEHYLKSMIEPLVRATKQAQWDGIGGASSYLDGGRIDVLEKKYGPKAKITALKIIFENIAVAADNAFDPIVLKKFVETNLDVIKAYAKEKPEFFLNNQTITEICRKALPSNYKRSLDRVVKKAATSQSEEPEMIAF